jgi:hypothetical protein
VTDPQRTQRDPSGWALSGGVFAASLLTLVGLFQVIAGLVAIFDDEFYVVARNYTFDLDTTAVENFFFIPYYPFCSIVVIALAVWVIWALTRPGAIEV